MTHPPLWRLLLPLVAVAAIGFLAGRGTAAKPEVVDVGLPDTAQLAFVDASPWGSEWPSLVVSPEGDFIVYVARRGPDTELWYRSLVSEEARPLPGTQGGYQPVISPQGNTVAFVAGRVLKRVPVDGSVPAVDVAEVVEPFGLMWNDPEEILVAADFGRSSEWVRVSDGRKSRVGGGCSWPAQVPGRDELFCGVGSRSGLSRIQALVQGVVPLEPDAGVVLGDSGRPFGIGRVVPAGQDLLVVDQAGNLVAARYDPAQRRVGPQRIVQRGLRRSLFTEMGHFGLTRSGDLIYVPGSSGAIGEFVALRPGGGLRTLPIPARAHLNFGVSHDGGRVAATSEGVAGTNELWVYDHGTGRGERVTTGVVGYPVWAEDGGLVFSFSPSPAEPPAVALLRPGTATPVRLQGPTFTPGQFVSRQTVVGMQGALTDIVVASLDGDRVARIDTLPLPGNQFYPVVSGDGRWLAYAGSERGISQVYVAPFPTLDRQYKVSADAASEPLWLPDGSLVYRLGSCWYQLRSRAGATPPLGPPAQIHCDDRFLNTSGPSNAAMPDGSILYLRTVRPTTGGYVRVVRNWRKTHLN
jgi:hypothetical protein